MFPGSTPVRPAFFSDESWLGPVRFGSFPRPVPAGSRVKRFGSVRPIRFGLLFLPVKSILPLRTSVFVSANPPIPPPLPRLAQWAAAAASLWRSRPQEGEEGGRGYREGALTVLQGGIVYQIHEHDMWQKSAGPLIYNLKHKRLSESPSSRYYTRKHNILSESPCSRYYTMKHTILSKSPCSRYYDMKCKTQTSQYF